MKIVVGPVAIVVASALGVAVEYATLVASTTQAAGTSGTVIDDKTLISLGTALAILSPLGIGCYWLTKTLDGIKKELGDLKKAGRETWSYHQMRIFALELAEVNREINLRVPKPARPIEPPKESGDEA